MKIFYVIWTYQSRSSGNTEYNSAPVSARDVLEAIGIFYRKTQVSPGYIVCVRTADFQP